ncbi:hypothetical protein L596_028023 [Steinernema carpocapsae]|uniref:Uncharacterized protein n=1 Tax=Steinernema carpocapsae TaxID=34508 RepID=A0A4U5LX85_STECR|nr:hypothetical protein L596_028023 [Steinernema carpocapsae]
MSAAGKRNWNLIRVYEGENLEQTIQREDYSLRRDFHVSWAVLWRLSIICDQIRAFVISPAFLNYYKVSTSPFGAL